jgi:hypothetical protein
MRPAFRAAWIGLRRRQNPIEVLAEPIARYRDVDRERKLRLAAPVCALAFSVRHDMNVGGTI